ncbi:hypothetical protein [Thermococcus sp. MAR1]|uniref:hypothetical protein n=1 Tax=Thermococcus sp. MAR1 TaxID=1638263 RepID=UPI001F0D5F82|nr:hypothetical protein [Thermococcus sp. MAR1]
MNCSVVSNVKLPLPEDVQALVESYQIGLPAVSSVGGSPPFDSTSDYVAVI